MQLWDLLMSDEFNMSEEVKDDQSRDDEEV